MGKKKKRDQSDFFYGNLESEESEEEEFPPKKHSNQLKMKNQEIELEKKPVQDGRIFVNSDKKKKEQKKLESAMQWNLEI
jgi:hypothetical protein